MFKLYKKFKKNIKKKIKMNYIFGRRIFMLKKWILEILKSLKHMWIWDPKDGE